MAKLLLSLGRAAEAIQIFTEALNFRENDWGILTNRGDCYNKIKEYDKAIADFKLALKQESVDIIQVHRRYSLSMTFKGISVFNAGKYDKALKMFTEALVLDEQTNPVCYAKRGVCQLKLGKIV